MRRQLTPREWMLLGLFGVILIVSGYILLFYTPMTSERDRCLSQAESCRTETELYQARLADKLRMEKELETLEAGGGSLVSIPDYDNIHPVILELDGILSSTGEYSLSFANVDTSQTIIRRNIAMSYSTGGYEAARAVLQRLHDCAFRCMLDDISMSFQQEDGKSASVSGTIIFFEYQKDPPAPAAEPGTEETA